MAWVWTLSWNNNKNKNRNKIVTDAHVNLVDLFLCDFSILCTACGGKSEHDNEDTDKISVFEKNATSK